MTHSAPTSTGRSHRFRRHLGAIAGGRLVCPGVAPAFGADRRPRATTATAAPVIVQSRLAIVLAARRLDLCLWRVLWTLLWALLWAVLWATLRRSRFRGDFGAGLTHFGAAFTGLVPLVTTMIIAVLIAVLIAMVATMVVSIAAIIRAALMVIWPASLVARSLLCEGMGFEPRFGLVGVEIAVVAIAWLGLVAIKAAIAVAKAWLVAVAVALVAIDVLRRHLRLHRADHAKIMLGMLKVVLGLDAIAR